MRFLVTLFIVLGSISPLHAQTELFLEDFEGAAPGVELNTLPGWSGPDGFVISATTIDQGQSLDCSVGSEAWPKISKDFSYAPGAEEQYVFSGTFWVGGTTDNYAHAQLGIAGSGARLIVALGYNELLYGYDDENGAGVGEPSGEYAGDAGKLRVPMVVNEDDAVATMDFKVHVSGDGLYAYWRLNGDAQWNDAGQITGGLNFADFTQVDLYGHGGYAGNLDTISLTVETLAVTLPGDANRDGIVNDADATILATNWQTMTDATWAMGDFNNDGAVNDQDATILATNWQSSTDAASVPEPATLTLLCLGGLILLLRVRRRFA